MKYQCGHELVVEAERWAGPTIAQLETTGAFVQDTKPLDMDPCPKCGLWLHLHARVRDHLDADLLCPGDWITIHQTGGVNVFDHATFLERFEPVEEEDNPFALTRAWKPRNLRDHPAPDGSVSPSSH